MSTSVRPSAESAFGLKIRVQRVRLAPWALESDPPKPPPFKRVGTHGLTPAWIRFWTKVERRGDCWIWTGSVNTDGYGLFGLAPTHRKPGLVLAHRLAYEWATGAPPPAGLRVIMHSCDVRACVRPAHLSPGTDADNYADAVRKGRSRVGVTLPAPTEVSP